ncbi:MAG: hypothetical protein LH660_10225 [Phormidesmis sp. CAN_BIN36]|nr:hypothetical protein [Phormidesmis sp. CAN_BIN36]
MNLIDETDPRLFVQDNRHLEQRREEIAKDARESIHAFHVGQIKPQPVEDIILELRQSLDRLMTNEKTRLKLQSLKELCVSLYGEIPKVISDSGLSKLNLWQPFF